MKNLIIGLLLLPSFCTAQILTGTVKDATGQTLIGANIYWGSDVGNGVSTDLNGHFSIPIPTAGDTLYVSYIGYETQRQFIKAKENTPLNIILQTKGVQMQVLEISASKSMSSEFSMMELERLDVYFNPVSSGDPLKAITLLPASTNADETANPELRGSAAGFSTVQLNGVPLVEPVRASSLNGIGYFSIINTELLGTMTVFPSNPPLYAGQTVAGLVEIETADEIDNEQFSVSLSLASIGFVKNKKLFKDKGYVQVYGNRQFSQLFSWLNGSRYDFLESFSNVDLGINASIPIDKHTRLKYLTYGISEQNKVAFGTFNDYGTAVASLKRNFHILSLRHLKGKSVFNTSMSFDARRSQYQYEGIVVDHTFNNWFLNSDWSRYFDNGLTVRSGISFRKDKLNATDAFPFLFSGVDSSTDHPATGIHQINNSELFTFLKYEKKDWTISAGLRGGTQLFTDAPIHYLSTQTNIKYSWSPESKIMLGVGQYNKLLLPSEANGTVNHLQSQQLTAEYFFKNDKWDIQLAAYHKLERYAFPVWSVLSNDAAQISERHITGVEAFVAYNFNKYLSASVSNTSLRSETAIGQRLNPSYSYFVKFNVQYIHPTLGTFGLAGVQRPGKFFNWIESGWYDEDRNTYLPVFGTDFTLNADQLPTYINWSFNYSRNIDLDTKKSLIIFLAIQNLTNRKNISSYYYNEDYSQSLENLYQPLSLYFGGVLSL